ncbi:hypothetical protein BDP67DRAFT_570684 [Colletotrichum lupini]|nr:hypothetical protein BDP67DRAFT_570684 [Colletotrichum lupini]
MFLISLSPICVSSPVERVKEFNVPQVTANFGKRDEVVDDFAGDNGKPTLSVVTKSMTSYPSSGGLEESVVVVVIEEASAVRGFYMLRRSGVFGAFGWTLIARARALFLSTFTKKAATEPDFFAAEDFAVRIGGISSICYLQARSLTVQSECCGFDVQQLLITETRAIFPVESDHTENKWDDRLRSPESIPESTSDLPRFWNIGMKISHSSLDWTSFILFSFVWYRIAEPYFVPPISLASIQSSVIKYLSSHLRLFMPQNAANYSDSLPDASSELGIGPKGRLWCPRSLEQMNRLSLESCNNGRGFCKGGRCEPNNDPSGAGPFVGNFKECQTGNGRSQVDDFILGGGNQDAEVNAGAACNNGRGTCSTRGACEPNNDPSGAGPFVGTFEECFS